MKNVCYLLLFDAFIFSSCRPSKIPLSGLIVKEFKYYEKGTDQLFTGTATSNFDNGNISNSIEIKDGIPNGKWIAYGYKGEIIQEGTYIPIDISDDDFLMQKKIKRLNVCFGKEGSYSSIDVYVIADTTHFLIDTSNFKNHINELCRKINLLSTKDKIDDIKITESELN